LFFLQDDFLEAAIFLMVFAVIQVFVVIFCIWLLRKRRIWPLIMCGLSGSGSLALNELADKGIEIIFSKKPITGIRRWTFDKVTGRRRMNWFPISKVWHTLAGTSIPVHFCPARNSAANVSLSDETTRGMNDEETCLSLQLAYEQGRVDERNLLPNAGKGPINMTLLLIIGGVVIGAIVGIVVLFPDVLGGLMP